MSDPLKTFRDQPVIVITVPANKSKERSRYQKKPETFLKLFNIKSAIQVIISKKEKKRYYFVEDHNIRNAKYRKSGSGRTGKREPETPTVLNR